MASSAAGRRVMIDALGLAIVLCLLFEASARQGMFATSLVLVTAAVMLGAALLRQIRKLERGAQAVALDAVERLLPISARRDTRSAPSALGRAIDQLGRAQQEQHGELDFLRALLDNVSAAVIAIPPEGAAQLMNRRAHELGAELDSESAGGQGAPGIHAMIRAMPNRRRQLIRTMRGRRMLVTSMRFQTGGTSWRVIALQDVDAEIDEAQHDAWRTLFQILAHEMMNSLTPVTTLADSLRPLLERLRQQNAGAGSEILVQDVITGVDAISRRGAGLVNFIERYRAIATLPKPLLRPVAVGDLIARILQLLAASLQQALVRYRSYVEPADLLAEADTHLLEQVLINLITNAVDAMAETIDRELIIRCDRHAEQVRIRVCDNGKGIDAATAERVFVPFFTTKPGGSGIGLSLARQIAVAHGGQLQLSANQPRGAVFTLLLPAAGGEASGAQTQGSSVAPIK